MTSVHRKQHHNIKRWFKRNSTYIALAGIILSSVVAGAIGCLAFVPRSQEIAPLKTEPMVAATPDIATSSVAPIAEPEIIYFEVPLSDELQDYIRTQCVEYNVPMTLIIAIIERESSFRPNVIGKSNDYGLMQINICNHEWLSATLGVSDFLDPYENVLCGIYIIADHLEKTDGNVELALMRYNCGETGAKKLWDKGIYSTSYSRSVMTLYESYKEKAANGAVTP